MKVVKKGAGDQYEAKRHFGNWSINKLVPGKDSKKISVGLSHFLPGGGAEMSSSPLERIYFVISGTIVVNGKAEEHTIKEGDVIYIGSGEDREFKVIGGEPATILVVMTSVE
jgi:quercetin dioxygenase-like cupin family protein